MWDKARVYCWQAGDKAYDRGAFHEAMTGYEQAIDALGHLSEQPDTRVLAIGVYRDLGSVVSALGEYQRSLALLGEAEARSRQLDERAQLGRVLSMSSWVRRIQGDLVGAMTASREALEIAATLGDPALQTNASHRLGQAYLSLGDFGRAAELLRGNVAAMERGTPGPVRFMGIFSQAWLARVLSALGEFTEGRHHGEAALRLALVEKRREIPIAAHGCLGLLYLAKGDLEAAIRVFERGLALGRASGGRDWSRDMAGGLGEAYAQAGRLAEGLALLEEARRDDVRTGALGSYPARFRQLSAVYLLTGRFDEASQQVYQALDLARQQQAHGEEAHVLFQLGAVHAHASPPDVQWAEARYREALTLAKALGMRPLQAHCHLGFGTLYLTMGRREEARTELTAAIELYRAMEMTFWLPQAETALAEVEGQ